MNGYCSIYGSKPLMLLSYLFGSACVYCLFQFSLFVSPQTSQSEHSIYFTKINVARKPKRNQYSLYYFGSPVTIFLFSSVRITVVRWHSVSNSKDN